MFITPHSGLSSIFGWISIACWIVVYSPQIYENYALQSGEGLSVPFVLIWLCGDLCNLIGASIAGLLPTIIILGCYYSVCDTTLLIQIHYYRWKHGHPLFKARRIEEDQERTPLLPEGEQDENKHLSTKSLVVRYTAALLFVAIVGTSAWWIAGDGSQQETPKPRVPPKNWWKSQVFGWFSAILFIGARIPQIIKNFTTKCKGLSPALFFFAMCGNVTYSLSIIARSTDKEYLLLNASWLAGSSLIIFLDVFVLCQFMYYRMQDRKQNGGVGGSVE